MKTYKVIRLIKSIAYVQASSKDDAIFQAMDRDVFEMDPEYGNEEYQVECLNKKYSARRER
jgi:hypothetical protein